MKTSVGIYFSGTGNSKYCLEKLLFKISPKIEMFSIEDTKSILEIQGAETIYISYPVQYSNIPKILVDFIHNNSGIWNCKKVFVIATMGLFSGDGSGRLARLLKSYGAIPIGGVHFKMPDCISDEKLLKHTPKEIEKIINEATTKVNRIAEQIKENHYPQQGMSFGSRMLGCFGQRLYFLSKTNSYSSKLKISDDCIGCGLCVVLCPMKNISLENNKAIASNQCTMCYRCINQCPKQAIALLGKQVFHQHTIEE